MKIIIFIMCFLYYTITIFSFPRFDDNLFIENVMESVKVCQKRGKVNTQIRYMHYCMWACELKVKEIGPEDANCKYPQSMLAFIRDTAPGDIIGEIREYAYEVTLETFCDCLGIPKQQL
ncbi:uncharacterized protein LOC130648084 [Hydractinia symbiolongicarpus]|uniref:uncharacterized protein LOC130648084 n=1 Tax=Hydractinia symbiolongicarpus TaxID=13093 RepID=UPI0025510582|nr:uncharacterized protein LOC130648084 [Hydractinia symbiolongicarpus]